MTEDDKKTGIKWTNPAEEFKIKPHKESKPDNTPPEIRPIKWKDREDDSKKKPKRR